MQVNDSYRSPVKNCKESHIQYLKTGTGTVFRHTQVQFLCSSFLVSTGFLPVQILDSSYEGAVTHKGL